jgi:hypothetical protein
VRGHDKLWRAGAFVYSRREVDAKVPALGSVPGRRGAKRAPGGGATTDGVDTGGE